MIKLSSIVFVGLLATLFLMSFLTIFLPASGLLTVLINIFAVLLLITGIILIISLIVDRYKDSKNEGDDYKKY
jgi:ABC-type transport system involved in cytochrome c biogenesis permease subunit